MTKRKPGADRRYDPKTPRGGEKYSHPIHGLHVGGKLHPSYGSWRAMKSRCLKPENHNFKNYGARGITVCERWLSFADFVADMGSRPLGTTLDRVNNDGNYEPGNVRWATPAQQMESRRTPKGESHPKAILTARDVLLIRRVHDLGLVSQVEIARTYSLSPSAIHSIVKRINWRSI